MVHSAQHCGTASALHVFSFLHSTPMVSSSSELVTSAQLTSINALATEFLDRIFRRKKDAAKPKPKRQVEEQIVPPWESWELDKDFFKSLSRWTLQNPESSLDRVLDRISNGLESNRDLIQLIPDAPFPARGLVTALAHLVKLGVRISRAKIDVQQFAKDVIRWVGLVKAAFETPGDGRFTRQAWQNLRDMRLLVDEACIWAVRRLEDGRWSRIEHGLRIQNEIQEFNRRMADARALFQDLSSISQAKGLDAILQKMHAVEHQETIMVEIHKIRETQEKQHNEIMSELEAQKQIAERNRFFTDNLNARTVADPTYDAQGKRPCDGDTRTEFLDDIRKWTNDLSPGTPNFLWLTGDPGCGKSAVTASLARECKDQGVLWAQFFINRNNAETTDPRSYFPSIARQLATHSSDVAETIHHILKEQLSLLDDISPNQASKLFTNSVRVASQIHQDRPVVIIIDGLDETRRDRLEDTADIFSTLFTSLEAYTNVKVFISSRTENEIQKSFVFPSNDEHVKRIHLDTSHPSSIRDVSQYIKRNLGHLVKKHDLNWHVWPGNERTEALGQRASGLFIWGVTAIKFIQEQLDSHGEECLDDVLNMLTSDVLYDINALYMLILTITHKGHEDEWELERFRRIVGAIVFLQEPLCINDIATLLDLRKTPTSKPVDIAHFVRRFRTILVSGTETIDGSTIPHIHKSVFEFVTGNGVDPKFRINPDHAHLELGIRSLAHLRAARKLVSEDALPVPFRYASRFWLTHIFQTKILGPSNVCADDRHSSYITSPTLYLGVSAFSVNKPVQIQHLTSASEIITAVQWPVIWDAVSGAPLTSSHGHQYHQKFIAGIVFSPDGSDIVSCSHDGTIKIRSLSTDHEIDTLINYSSKIEVVAFSSNSKLVAFGSHDGLVHLWDYSTRVPLGKPFLGHKERITCLALSSDGERIVSGSHDKTCILWDTRTGHAIGEPWTGHELGLRSVAFSSSGWRVCSIDDGGYCIIWGSAGQKIGDWKYRGYPKCMSFSPEDDSVIAVGGVNGIDIRSDNREWYVPGSWDVQWFSFSPDGREVIFSTFNTIYVAYIGDDTSTARIIRKRRVPHTDYINTCAFSPNFDYFVYADMGHAIHLFTLQHDKESLQATPIDLRTHSSIVRKIDGDKKLKNVLSRMKEAQHIHDAVRTTNRCLRDIKWHETDLGVGATESDIKLCMMRDDAIIAGYKDGSVCVWDQFDTE